MIHTALSNIFYDGCNAIRCTEYARKKLQVAPHGFKNTFSLLAALKNVAETLKQNQKVFSMITT